MRAWTSTVLLALVLSAVLHAEEQGSDSSAAAAKLVALLHSRSLEAVATADPAQAGRFAAALYLPGSQLLAISAISPDPMRVAPAIAAGNHRQVYMDLHTQGAKAGRLFVMDLQADGLQPTANRNQPFDIVWEDGMTQTVYDGDWKRQKLTEDAYQRRFAEADREYAALLRVLIAAVEGASPTPE